MLKPVLNFRQRAFLALAISALMVGCGGGGSGSGSGSDGDGSGGSLPPDACSVVEQNRWLANTMDDAYLWYALAPRPDPAPYTSVADYFDARLYTGTVPDFPADRWSNFASTESFNRFFGDGQALGYGVSVAGLEIAGRPDLPLQVRYVEANSPAARAGVQRGDQVISLNGRSAAELVSANDFSALSASTAGQTLALTLRRGGADRVTDLIAATFALTPVSAGTVLTSAGGRRLGYVVVKDMISQALAPLETAFARFRAAGVEAVVLDLRYNGGGLVSVGGTVASYVAGPLGQGRVFADLLYNDKLAATNNTRFNFSSLGSALGLARVYVLTGPRTCSASEQVINGLRGVGIDVVAIGDTTCGKPVGFLPASNCGTTYSVVNFESVNQRNEGRYFDGFAPTCAVAEDVSRPLGAADEPLLAAAALFADTGACPAVAVDRRQPAAAPRIGIRRAVEAGERQGMIVR
jgi:carboxyl-terminal processing protease